MPPEAAITFLFTDIEGSTRLWEEDPEEMRVALARHDAILRQAITASGGIVFKTVGDQFCAAFTHAPAALSAALAAQQAFLDFGFRISDFGFGESNVRSAGEDSAASSPNPKSEIRNPKFLRVRIALYTGTAVERDGDYLGPSLSRISRLVDAAHGGQTLLSQTTYDCVRDALPPDVGLRDLGSHRFKDLQQPEHVHQLLHPSLPADFPPLNSLDALPHNLPQQLTSFVGREREIAEVKRLLGTTRLLTLTGSGGCGKTRLALQVAAETMEAYPDGVWLADLAVLSDPALVAQSVASALRLREQPGRRLIETLADFLRPRSLLLLLDNCEHVLTACAELADSLLRLCPELRIAATSREVLGMAGELNYPVAPLSLPAPGQGSMVHSRWFMRPSPHQPSTIDHQPSTLLQYEAVRLFVERATFSLSGFALTTDNCEAVAQLCQRLDGIPLAIELAAARVKVLSVEEITARLDDRFRLLTGGSRTALPRQQTLRAALDWSYDLLTEPERALLRRLSVFTGGFTLEAAEGVCTGEGIGYWVLGVGDGASGPIPNTQYPIPGPEVLDLLTALVEKSLVVVEDGRGPGSGPPERRSRRTTRYRMLETLREYSRDRLMEAGEVAAVRSRHRDWFLKLAERAEPELNGPAQGTWLDELENEHDNLRAALAWSVEVAALSGGREEAVVGLRLGGALCRFWWLRGYLAEGREALTQLLALPSAGERTAARARVLFGAGNFAWHHGDDATARSLLEESVAIGRDVGDVPNLAFALTTLGRVEERQGDYPAARRLHAESAALFRQIGDRSGLALALSNLGRVAYQQGDLAEARALNEESGAIFREVGDRLGLALSLNNLGEVARCEENYPQAGTLYDECLSLFRELGHKNGMASALHNLGHVAQHQGDSRRAAALFRESLSLATELENRHFMAACLAGLAAAAGAGGHPARAARLFGAAEALFESIGALMDRADRAEYDRHLATARAALGEPAFESARIDGRRMGTQEAILEAIREP